MRYPASPAKRLIVVAKIPVIWERLTRAVVCILQEGQLVRPLDWQRTQDEGIHNTEDRSVRANAQGERQDCDGSEARRLA